MTTRAQYSRGLASPIHLAVLALLAGAAGAQAQTAAAPAAAASAPGSGAALQEVTVTATKRTTSLQSTPLAVTPIGAAEIEKNHVQTIADVVHLAPSFQATTEGDHGVITMTMRGIGNDGAKSEYADPEVALFVDGIYAPRAEGAAALLFDMDGIEVLRGPQGTLWGRNSTVGAVNMKTAKADLSGNFGNFELGLGNYNRQGARGAFNIQLTDTFAIRAAFVHEQHDGYVSYQKPPTISLADQHAAADPYIATWNASHGPNNQLVFRPIDNSTFVQGGPKYNAQDQTAERLSFVWKPINNLRWDASYEHFVDHGTPNMNLMQHPREGESFWSALISVAPELDRSVNTFRTHVSWDLSDYLNLNYTAGYSKFEGSEDFDNTGGAVLPTSFTTGGLVQENRTNWAHYKNYSHELQLQSTGTHELDWIVGLYYAGENNGIRFDIPQSNGTQEGTIGWAGSFIQPKETVGSEAVFGQTTWNVGDKLHLTGGLRFTHDDRKNEGGVNYSWANNPDGTQAPIDPSTNPATDTADWTVSAHNDGHYTGHKATWLARANYDFSKTEMAYASVSTGYKSGGLADGGVHYAPETLTNYEVGSKSTLFDGAVHFNNSVYYEDFKNFQILTPVTNADGSHSTAIANAQSATSYGLETELTAAVTKDDTVSLGAAYLHTRMGFLIASSNDYSLPACATAAGTSCLNVTGHQLPHSPKFSGTLQYEHAFHMADGGTLSPRVALHYETRSTLSIFDLAAEDEQKAYTRTDLGLRYQAAKDWYVDAFVRNVEDGRIKTSALNGNGGVWQAQYMAPRTFGLNAGYSF